MCLGDRNYLGGRNRDARKRLGGQVRAPVDYPYLSEKASDAGRA